MYPGTSTGFLPVHRNSDELGNGNTDSRLRMASQTNLPGCLPESTGRSEQKSCYFRHCAGFVSCTQLATDLDSAPTDSLVNKKRAERNVFVLPIAVGGEKKGKLFA